MSKDYQFKLPSLLKGPSMVSMEDPYKPPSLRKFPSSEIFIDYERQPPFSRMSSFFLYDSGIPLGPRRSVTYQNYPPPLQHLQSQKSQIIETRQKVEIIAKEKEKLEKEEQLQQIEQEESDVQDDREQIKRKKQQQNFRRLQIQKKIKKKRYSELEQQPCFCRNSGCLKRYCRCFHSGRMCLKECQCVEGCLNNHDHLEQRNDAIKHVNEKCHRNKNVPKDALFKLKDCFGCNCKKTRCQTGYCECFLRKSKCTIDCQCENCENGLDEAYLESQQKRKNYRAKRK
ncbi:unnamed protein product [Paramecium octaurelia]|uniref:CRC domain-containing protein n=1 Tax=Paramecium octaurelia TaxID=43137 RepID=A0A8S1VHU9_PAROT|nr:unnamed protein product [Paramecium octaurelia]